MAHRLHFLGFFQAQAGQMRGRLEASPSLASSNIDRELGCSSRSGSSTPPAGAAMHAAAAAETPKTFLILIVPIVQNRQTGLRRGFLFMRAIHILRLQYALMSLNRVDVRSLICSRNLRSGRFACLLRCCFVGLGLRSTLRPGRALLQARETTWSAPR